MHLSLNKNIKSEKNCLFWSIPPHIIVTGLSHGWRAVQDLASDCLQIRRREPSLGWETGQGKGGIWKEQVRGLGIFFWMFGVWTLGAYICTSPNSRFFHLGLDNSRLLLDENCLIGGENRTNLVYFVSNSCWRIAREIHILCQQLRELLFAVAILVDLDFPKFSVHFFHT